MSKGADVSTGRSARPGHSVVMQTYPHMIARVEVHFAVDPCSPPEDAPIHDGLRALRALEIEAPSQELAELYAALVVDALERAGN